MSREIQAPFLSGRTLYAVLTNQASGLVWDGSGLETPTGAHWAAYAVALAEQGGSGLYEADFPAAPAGPYGVLAYLQVGGGPAPSDPVVAAGAVGWSGSGFAAPPQAPARDDDVYQAIVTLLKATGAFDDVHYPGLPEDQGVSAAEGRFAAVVPGEGDEQSEWDDGRGPADVLRRVTWTLQLEVRDADPATRARALDLLFSAAANAVSGQSLAGLTLPAWTTLRRSKVGRAVAPGQPMTCGGTFAYFLDGWANHDTTP